MYPWFSCCKMKNKIQNRDKQPFFRRYWWGIFCTILFFVGGAHQCSTSKKHSSIFGGPIYICKAEKGAVLQVQNTNNSFKILVVGGETFYYSKGSDTKINESPYPFTESKNSVQIIGLTPRLPQEEMNALWGSDNVRTHKNKDGTIKVVIGYDVPGPQVLSGVYFVNGDTISGHHFMYGSLLTGIVFMIGVLVLYTFGATIKGIIQFVRWRKYRHQIGSKEG